MSWERLQRGNIVRWHGDLYIVGEVRASGLELLSVTCPNASSYPSLTWPKDEKKNVTSVKFVSRCMKDYIMERLSNMMFDEQVIICPLIEQHKK